MSGAFDELASFCRRFMEIDIHCLVVGSVAAMRYGEPRATIDVDLVVYADPDQAGRIAAGFDDQRYYVPPVDVIARELSRPGGMFNIIDSETGLKADCYRPAGDELGRYEREHAQPDLLGSETVYFAPAAGVIAMKLRYHALSGQEKHLRDIRAMVALSPEAIDRTFLDGWTKRNGLWEVWQSCLGRSGDE